MAMSATGTHNNIRKMLYGSKDGKYTLVSTAPNVDPSTENLDFPTNRSNVTRGRVTLKSGETVDLSDKGVKTLLQRANISQKNVKKVIILRHPKVKTESENLVTGQPSVSFVKREMGKETWGKLGERNVGNGTAAAKLVHVSSHQGKPTKVNLPTATRSMMNKFVLQKKRNVQECENKLAANQNSVTGRDVSLTNITAQTASRGMTAAVNHHDDTAARQQAMNDSLTNINWLGGASINPDLEISMQDKQKSKANMHINEGCHKRPAYSYMSMIQFAISSKPQKKMTLQEIYMWIETNFPYFKTAKLGWKNSIRHNLSLHDIFVREKPQESGKPSFWKLKEEAKPRPHTPLNFGYLPASPVIGPQGVVYSPVYTPLLPSNDVDARKNVLKSRNTPILPRLTQSFAIIPIMVQTTATTTNPQPMLAPAPPSVPLAPPTTPTILPANPGTRESGSSSGCTAAQTGKRKREGSRERSVTKKVKIDPKVSVFGDGSYSEASVNSSRGNMSSGQGMLDLSTTVDSGMESQISEAEQSLSFLGEAHRMHNQSSGSKQRGVSKVNRSQPSTKLSLRGSKHHCGQYKVPAQSSAQTSSSKDSHGHSKEAREHNSWPRVSERSKPIILRSRKSKKTKLSKETLEEQQGLQENIDLNSYLSDMLGSLEDFDTSTFKFLTKTPPRESKALTSTPNKKVVSPSMSPLTGITQLKMLENIDSGMESLGDIRLPFGLSPVRGSFSTPGKAKLDTLSMASDLRITPEKTTGVDCTDGPLDFPRLEGACFGLGSPKLASPGRLKLDPGCGSLRIGSLSELGLAGLTPLKSGRDHHKHDHNQSFNKFLSELNLSGYIGEDEIDVANLSWGGLDS